MEESRYYVYFKPYGVLSQFSDEGEHPGLKQFIRVPTDVYPVGRLDRDSEGLLVLTNDKKVNNFLLDPLRGHWRSYLVQVEGEATEAHMTLLRQPMLIQAKDKQFKTLPARAEVLNPQPEMPERTPPIRFRASIPTTWIRLELREGKNRQVRKMTAKVGLPTLRLVRERIEDLSIVDMQPGELKEIPGPVFYTKLKLNQHRGSKY